MTKQKRNQGGYESKISTKIESIEVEHSKVLYIMSGEAPDRYQDVIRQNGWQLENFNAHPVLISSHEYRGLTNQIGEWSDLQVRGKGESRQLIGQAKYYVGDGNPEADWGFKLAQRHRSAVSVGFQPIEYAVREGFEEDWWPPLEFIKSELLECSQVTVPAHQDALQLMMKSEHPELRELAAAQLKDFNTARDFLLEKEHGGPITQRVKSVAHDNGCCLAKDCREDFVSDSFPLCERHAKQVFARYLDEESPVSEEETEEGITIGNLFLEAIKEGILEKGAVS